MKHHSDTPFYGTMASYQDVWAGTIPACLEGWESAVNSTLVLSLRERLGTYPYVVTNSVKHKISFF